VNRTFVDVGVVRIGEYLTRVNKLRGIRGASDVISAATADDAVLKVLADAGHHHAKPNPDLGHADGVVHLELDQPDQAEAVVELVLAHLRRALPGADLVGAWAQGPDYASAADRLHAGKAEGPTRNWLPVVAECPWLNPCTACGRRAARGPGKEATCTDCTNRLDAKRGSARELRTRLGDFDFASGEIKSLVPQSETKGPADNHVAMISADGNSVGALFRALVANPQVTADGRRAVSRGLADVTVAAFGEAATAITGKGGTKAATPIIPVLHGGDDLCVFVTATQAWPFLRTLLTAFSRLAATMLHDALGEQLAATVPELSMSAGLAFTPVKHPAPDTFVVADSLMRRAKRLTHGSGASVSWLDITTNGVAVGDDPTAGRPAARLDQLEAMAGALTDLAALNQSARKGLVRAVTDLAGLDLDDDLSRRYLRHQAERLGVTTVLDPFLAPDSPVPPGDALDLARWWR
jgi:hypothetical protein